MTDEQKIIYDTAINSLDNVGNTKIISAEVPDLDKTYFEERGCRIISGNSDVPIDRIIRVSPKKNFDVCNRIIGVPIVPAVDKTYFLDKNYDANRGHLIMNSITEISPQNKFDTYDSIIESLNNIEDKTYVTFDIPYVDKTYFSDRGCMVFSGNSHLPIDIVTRVSPKGRVKSSHVKH